MKKTVHVVLTNNLLSCYNGSRLFKLIMDGVIMRIGVIMGGISSEREVSLNTGKEIMNNLDKKKYEVIPIVINNKEDIIEKTKDIDFAFLALHGKVWRGWDSPGCLGNIEYTLFRL